MEHIRNTREAYNQWASQYDTNQNKTRDLEGLALRATLEHVSFDRCLEIGCGTGKNTRWLMNRAKSITAVDLSEEMLARAREKITEQHVCLVQADITGPWHFRQGLYDLVGFSLVLEHIDDLVPVFREAAASLVPGGHLYLGELHPFKQYTGSKARFETEEGLTVVPCFNHHISDFTGAARQQGLELVSLEEHFDDNDRTAIPRILTLLFRKPGKSQEKHES